MTLAISTDLNASRLAAVLSFLDQGAATARIRIYGSARPATGGAPGAAPLVEIVLTDPAGTIADGILILTAQADPMVSNSGNAVWARVVNGNDVFAFDCDVSNVGGSGEVQINSTQLYAGALCRLMSAALG